MPVVWRKRRLADNRNIQQCVDTSVNHSNDILAKARECVCSRRSGVNHSGYSLGDTVRIGWDTQGRYSIVDVSMNINQPRRDNLASSVEYLAGFGFRDVCRDLRDLAS